MKKINKHIEIVSSTLEGCGSMSRSSRDAIRRVLERQYSSVGITIINHPRDLEALATAKPDLVFLGMKYIPMDPKLDTHDQPRVWISEYLDTQGITYTGSGPHAIKLEATKQLAKQRVLDAGLASARYKVIRRAVPQALQTIPLTYPVFIKPTNKGGGLGVDAASLATDTRQVTRKLTAIMQEHGSDALVEEYLPGREFSVAVLKDSETGVLQLMPIELIADVDKRGSRMLSGAVKSANSEQVVDVDAGELRDAICDLARNCFIALGARDYGRIDIRLSADGTPHFLEANLYPSLISGYGSFPKACERNNNLDYEAMILAITNLALTRSPDDFDELFAPYGQLVTA